MKALLEGPPPVDVLIVEDDALVRRGLRTLLEGEGYCCEEAGDGRRAVEMARRSRPRCAILDLVMPEMDGLTVARQLRADPQTRDIHIHCLTGVTDASTREAAEQAGFETYMTKPVDPSQLLGVIRREVRQPNVVEASGLTLADARDLLDFWQNAGHQNLEASYEEDKGFIVRGVRPARDP